MARSFRSALVARRFRNQAMQTLGLCRLFPVRTPNRIAGAQRKSVSKRLYAFQGGKCGVCGQSLGGAKYLTLDHVFPRRWQFGNVGNMVVAHHTCNQRKGGREPTGCEIIWLQVANAGIKQNHAGQSYARVAQLAEASALNPDQCGFDPHPAHHC